MSNEIDPKLDGVDPTAEREVSGAPVEKISRLVGDSIHAATDQSKQHPQVAPELLERLQSQKRKVLGDVHALLQSSDIADETDRSTVAAAFRFLENPTENIAEMVTHTTHIGEVMAGYEMQSEEAPPAIDAMHAHLLSLQCINRITFVEAQLASAHPDVAAIKQTMVMASQDAKTLARGYKDGTYLNAISELQGKVDSL